MLTRRSVALVTSALLLVEVLFPPFDPPKGWNHHAMQFWFLFSPPGIQHETGFYPGTINIQLLALELLVTLAIGWLWIRFVAKT